MNRGSSGTNGELKSAIILRSTSTNSSAFSVVTPALLDDGLAIARAQHDERILAEERVPADVLAAFDALEQERVVGVLGDAQERRDRRQQVGDELLDDRHEGASSAPSSTNVSKMSVS